MKIGGAVLFLAPDDTVAARPQKPAPVPPRIAAWQERIAIPVPLQETPRPPIMASSSPEHEPRPAPRVIVRDLSEPPPAPRKRTAEKRQRKRSPDLELSAAARPEAASPAASATAHGGDLFNGRHERHNF